MKALITGIRGFVGGYLRKELESHNIETFGIARAGVPENNILIGDVLDEKRINQIIKNIQPDVIFHLAGFSSVRKSWEDPKTAMKVNKNGTENIYKAVIKNKLNSKIIIASSGEVYGKTASLPINENAPCDPKNPYSISKFASEQVVKNFEVPSIICRSFNHTGPTQQHYFAVPSFCRQIALIEKGEEKKILVGDLNISRDFTDVRDVVRAYYLLSASNKWGEIYNICSNHAYSLKEILNILIGFTNAEIQIISDVKKFRPEEIPILRGDYRKIKRDVGWEPKIPLKTTLLDTLNYWRAQVNFK